LQVLNLPLSDLLEVAHSQVDQDILQILREIVRVDARLANVWNNIYVGCPNGVLADIVEAVVIYQVGFEVLAITCFLNQFLDHVVLSQKLHRFFILIYCFIDAII